MACEDPNTGGSVTISYFAVVWSGKVGWRIVGWEVHLPSPPHCCTPMGGRAEGEGNDVVTYCPIDARLPYAASLSLLSSSGASSRKSPSYLGKGGARDALLRESPVCLSTFHRLSFNLTAEQE